MLIRTIFEKDDSTQTVSVVAIVYSRMRNQQTPLGPIEEEALERLCADYEPVDDSFSRAVAIEILREIDLEPSVGNRVLDRLLSKGYLYVVNDELYITD